MDESTEHGPGVRWLAERAGREPDELLRDGPGLLAALGAAARDALALAARAASEDPSVRARAQAEARALHVRLLDD